jgi:Kef-type K+ transport system membrane component KefB
MSDQQLTHFMLSIVLLLLSSLIFSEISKILKLPRVAGEIFAGIVLGPSIFGLMFPNAFNWVFNFFEIQQSLLAVFYWLGLIFLMFTAGFNIPENIPKKSTNVVILLLAGGLLAPFSIGFIGSSFFSAHMPSSNKELTFSLFMGIAASVTSIPVLSHIMLELKIIKSKFAQSILTASGFQDIILWIILSYALATNHQSDIEISNTFVIGKIIFGLIIFLIFSLIYFPKIMKLIGPFVYRQLPENSLIGFTLLSCLILVTLAAFLQINLVFGALVAGLAINRLKVARLSEIKQSITNLSLWFFTPIYFSLIGLKINLHQDFNLSLFMYFFLLTSLIKISSVTLFVKFSNISWRNAFDYGVGMNARGGPGIVLASIGLASSIIDGELYVALILTSIATSVTAGIWLRFKKNNFLN